ncbi:unnamed protein product (macronuclear) [Paramecium tetraurelia]|uniref:Uncharacterized protein n=1 Tax=Paramecium tetraurelia TaxID=5888 RepID=A0CKM7_PARTE|nr:uncharacterized protein GSPATT00001058001 [Paramecium tetraurelia]CAK71344.1 unnamed protein product [Paramecium tetraurelia]|eukprot:XP_001438741.1 hypothetical protein (macronuclear) [Paramecium tetraurelia strain d4-2]
MNKSQCYLPNQKQFYAPIILTLNMMYLSGMLSVALNSQLQNGILYFGCAVGSRLYKYIQRFSNRVVFYISDFILLVSLLPIYFVYPSIAPQPDLGNLALNFLIGIAGVMMYLRLKYTDEAISFFSLFIPLQFAIGSILNAILSAEKIYFVTILIYLCATGARILLISIIPFSGLSQNVKQLEEELLQRNQTTELQVNQTEEGHEKFLQAFLKNFKYLILVIIFQTSLIQFQYHPSQLFMIIFNMIFYDSIDKNRLIVLGQISVCFGYCSNLTSFSNSGYYLGLGTLFYPIVCKISTSELIVIAEISWIIRLATMCYIAVMQKISYNLFLLDSEVQNNVFFILNFVSLTLLISLLFYSKKPEKTKVEEEVIMEVQNTQELNES